MVELTLNPVSTLSRTDKKFNDKVNPTFDVNPNMLN